ncbi:MAG: hypothetical protein ABSF70_11445 [Terracidiphilus sp.]|jgi:hypothetical protein
MLPVARVLQESGGAILQVDSIPIRSDCGIDARFAHSLVNLLVQGKGQSFFAG